MARNSKQTASWERQDAIRMQEAVAEISRSRNLRYFIRNLLGATGISDVFPSENALAMARQAGKHELGLSIVATLTQYQPELWPNLLLEEQNEILSRTTTAPTYERPERGEPATGDDDTTRSDNGY